MFVVTCNAYRTLYGGGVFVLLGSLCVLRRWMSSAWPGQVDPASPSHDVAEREARHLCHPPPPLSRCLRGAMGGRSTLPCRPYCRSGAHHRLSLQEES
jgi:hypothetical protein